MIVVFLGACSGPLNQSWTNFRAYYNTYYNAEKSFETGRNKVYEQPNPLHADKLIRIHPEMPAAGAQEFQNAIEKAADILRVFPDSRWTDDALFLIGKSYYYRKEYARALQKFEELYGVAEKSKFRQQAVKWKGRTLLDLQRYDEAILYLEEKLAELSEEWDGQYKTDVNLLIAEHYSLAGNWLEAANRIENILPVLVEDATKSRTLFLYGQLLERMEKFKEAFAAFSEVTSVHTDYQYSYRAELNKGIILRKSDNFDDAVSLFSKMKRDSKNFNRIDEIDFQIAKTIQQQGLIMESEELYKKILNSSVNKPSNKTRSQVYYQLGEIYTHFYNNYNTATAYFDSSSIFTPTPQNADNLDVNDTNMLVSGYKKYASLKAEEQKTDSLLRLGSFSAEELDSVLLHMRNQQLQQSSREKVSGNENILLNVNETEVDNGNSDQGSDFGFLNYRNSRFVNASKKNFRVLWNNRPLVDNWRRAEAVQSGRGSLNSDSGLDFTEITGKQEQANLNIDTDEIPRSPAERSESLNKLSEIRYNIGNHLFLTLNMPDSAEIYFKKVIEGKETDNELIARSMYALFELNRNRGEEQKATDWGDRIMNEFPETKYADRVEKFFKSEPVPDGRNTTKEILQGLKNIEQVPDSAVFKPEEYRQLALKYEEHPRAVHIHFRAVEKYVEWAKFHTDSVTYYQYWQASVSLGTEIAGTRINPFRGAHWDSVRTLITEHRSVFEEQPYKNKIDRLHEILFPVNAPENPLTCKELEITPRVKPDMETFLENIKFPDSLKNNRLSGTLTYTLFIGREGQVKGFELVSGGILEELEEVYNEVIRDSLEFYPLSFFGEADYIKCEVSFPVFN